MLTDERFWALIDVMGGTISDRSVLALQAELRSRSIEEVENFVDSFSKALYDLDRRDINAIPITDTADPSRSSFVCEADDFLYARCCVVAAGRGTYEAIKEDPAEFARPWPVMSGELLLYAAEDVYEELTGQEWDRDYAYNFETGSNREGKPGFR